MKKFLFIPLAILLLCSILIISGSSILTKPIVEGGRFPYGNLLSWVALIALSFSIYFGINKIYHPITITNKIFSYAYRFLITLPILWGLVSYYLANNWAFTFKQQKEFRGGSEAAEYFWLYTIVCAVFPLIYLLVYWLVLLFMHLKRKV